MQDETPKGWDKVPLKRLIKDIGDGGTPARSEPSYFGGSVNWVVINDIVPHIRKTEETLTVKGLNSCGAKLWPAGSIIVSTGATIGEAGIADIPMATKQGITGIVLDSSKLNNDFFRYQLEFNKDLLIRFSQGTSFTEIRPPTLIKLEFLYPKSVKEQQKIAAILQSIDNTIEKTKELIEKHKKMKQGLMKDLFTKGLDENGKPHSEFRDSDLGKIPKEWDVKTILQAAKNKNEAVQTGPFGAQLHSYDYVDEGIPLILIRNIINGEISDQIIPHITQKKANTLRRYWIKEGDIVFSRVADVGRSAVAGKQHNGWLISGQMLRVRLSNPAISNLFVKYLIESKSFQDALRFKILGSTRDSINTEILESMPIAIPDLKEQNRISETLYSLDAKMNSEQTYSHKLIKLKAGLMQDLLTGKVRVKMEPN